MSFRVVIEEEAEREFAEAAASPKICRLFLERFAKTPDVFHLPAG